MGQAEAAKKNLSHTRIKEYFVVEKRKWDADHRGREAAPTIFKQQKIRG